MLVDLNIHVPFRENGMIPKEQHVTARGVGIWGLNNVCMCIYIYGYIHTYIYIYTYIYIHIYLVNLNPKKYRDDGREPGYELVSVENLTLLLKTWIWSNFPLFATFCRISSTISKPHGGCVPRCQKLSCFKLLARQVRSKSDSHVRHLGLRVFTLGLD